ncbi:molybdopterin-synthase adenylyltransferase MoeB [Nakamurella lactea]|uniref:molybdopterin-synthase adenylyltransferase MoeB n=1 Tax=Nakamurella lactea TaxID=459515 RepID=UPI00048BC9A4|nr:molybdopterin-synthase adenylyltransferase MoeB [Nakamurella lactea]
MSLPPLVEPGAELSPAEIERYSRHLLIPDIGHLGQRRLGNARVLVVGAGGLGAPALTYLAAAGVGTIGVVDDDVVELSNLQRQVIHGADDVGRPKTESAAAAIARVNPLVTVVQHRVRVDSDSVLDLIADYHLVLDGTDNFATRYLLNDACVLTGLPYVWGSILRFEGQVSVFWSEHGPHYRDVYPVPPAPGTVPSCAEAGVLGLLCATVGSVMGTEAVKLICGIGDPLVGRILMYDALDMTFRTVRVQRDPQGEPVTGLIDYQAFCGTGAAVSVDPAAEIGAAELKDLLDTGVALTLIDVREPAERAIAAIEGAIPIRNDDILSGAALAGLPRGRPIVLHCKSGGRSAQSLAVLHRAGFADARHLRGGILAWMDQVDPGLTRY